MMKNRPQDASGGQKGDAVNRDSRRREEDQVRVGWKMAGLGFETGAQVAAGALLGYFFDAWQGTSPNGVLVGGVAGIAVAMWTLIKGALKLNRQLDRMGSTTGRRKPPPLEDDDWNDDSNDHHSHNDADE